MSLLECWDAELPPQPFELQQRGHSIVWDGQRLRLTGASEEGEWAWEEVRVKLSRSMRAKGAAWSRRFYFPAEEPFVHVELQLSNQKTERMVFSAPCSDGDGRGLPWLEARGEACRFDDLRQLLPTLHLAGASLSRAESGREHYQHRVIAIPRAKAAKGLGLVMLVLLAFVVWQAASAVLEPTTSHTQASSFWIAVVASILGAVVTVWTLLRTRIWLSSARVSLFGLGFSHLDWREVDGITRILEKDVLRFTLVYVRKPNWLQYFLSETLRVVPVLAFSASTRAVRAHKPRVSASTEYVCVEIFPAQAVASGLNAVLNADELSGSERSARLDALLEERGQAPGSFVLNVYLGSLFWLLVPLVLLVIS